MGGECGYWRVSASVPTDCDLGVGDRSGVTSRDLSRTSLSLHPPGRAIQHHPIVCQTDHFDQAIRRQSINDDMPRLLNAELWRYKAPTKMQRKDTHSWKLG